MQVQRHSAQPTSAQGAFWFWSALTRAIGGCDFPEQSSPGSKRRISVQRNASGTRDNEKVPFPALAGRDHPSGLILKHEYLDYHIPDKS
jgi:hypothetical protein